MHIDLSVGIDENTPVYPGDPKTKIKPAGILARDGFTDHLVTFGTHVGTHVDAPIHMLAGGKALNQMPIEKFTGRGIYIKVNDLQFSLEDVKAADIQSGDIVLFHTGLAEKYYDPAYFEDYPNLPEDIATYLVEKKISMVGLDMCSPDHKPFDIHKILLGGDVLIIENLTNLHQLEGKDFRVYAFPVNLKIDAAPARVVAEIQL